MSYDKEPDLQAEIKAMQESEQNKTNDAIQKQESPNTPVAPVEPVKDIQSEVQQNEYQPKDEWEERALKIGWNPEHQGENKVEAREYVLRKPLFERIERQSTELRNIKERQRQHDNNLAQVRKESYEQALRDIEAKRDNAIEQADVFEARKLDAQAKALNKQMQLDPIVNVPQIQQEIHPDILEFGKKHAFLVSPKNQEEQKMKAAADAVDLYLTQQAQIDGNQIHVKTHLAQIEAELHRLFPHKFTGPTRKIEAVQQVGKSSTFKTGTDLANRLSANQKEVLKFLQKTNPEYTLEQYANDLNKMGRLAN